MIGIGSGLVRTALYRAPFARPRVPAATVGAALISTTSDSTSPRYVFVVVNGVRRHIQATRPTS